MSSDAAPDFDVFPRCFLLPKGEGPRTLHACRPDDPEGVLVHIHDAPNGKTGLLCPDCRGELVARHGKVRAHSFAHWRGDECAHAGETAAHRIAKDLILEAGSVWLPEQHIVGALGLEVIRPAAPVTFDRIVLEKREDGIQPDLVGIIVDDSGKEHKLLLEILVTHKVDAAKKEKIRAQDLAVIEIDISKVDRAMDRQALADWVLKGAPRHWVHHPKLARLQRTANSERERIERQKKDRRAFAVAAREARDLAREEARGTPPAKSAEPIEAWIAHESRRLSLMQLDDLLLNASGADDIFDVPPQAWRMVALWPSVPWRDPGRPGIDQRDRDACVIWAADELRRRGWVKPAFHAPERDFTGHGFRERDFVRDACLTFLESFTRLATGYERHEDLMSKLRFTSSQLSSVRSCLLGLCEAFGKQGVDVTWGEGKPLGEETVDDALLERLRMNIRLDEHRLVRTSRNISGSLDGLDAAEVCSTLAAARLGLRHRAESKLDTPGIVSRILGMHLAAWQRRFDLEAGQALEESLSVFRSMMETWPGLGEVLSRTEVGPLLQGRDLAQVAGLNVSLTSGEREARSKLRGLVEEIGILARELRSAEQVAQGFGPGLLRQQAFLFLAGSVADMEADHLRVIGDAGMVQSARNALEVLERKSGEHGFGEAFVERALSSCPTGCTQSLLALLMAGPQVDLRKAVADIRSRRDPPAWVRQDAPPDLFVPAFLPT